MPFYESSMVLDPGFATLMIATPLSRALLENKWANSRRQVFGALIWFYTCDHQNYDSRKVNRFTRPNDQLWAKSCKTYKAGMRGPFSGISIKWLRVSKKFPHATRQIFIAQPEAWGQGPHWRIYTQITAKCQMQTFRLWQQTIFAIKTESEEPSANGKVS